MYLTGFSQTMDNIQFEGHSRKITFEKNGFQLDKHCISNPVPFTEGFGHCLRWQHLQDMIRLSDANGKEYYMGTFSQNCSDTEGGMVFVAEVNKGGSSGKVMWLDELNNKHRAGGYNHPGDLRRVGNTVIIAGQNWDKTYPIGDPMDIGNGGQNVLFYDVSNPAAPKYTGKMNRCQNVVATSDIDAIAAVKVGSTYFLLFNGVPGGSVTCKCNEFSANGNWELVQDANLGEICNIEYSYEGLKTVGGTRLQKQAGNTVIAFDIIDTKCKRTSTVVLPIPATSFGDGTTFNISMFNSNRAAVVYANVESDDRIEIEVIESLQ
jgi:hypothetical protein